MISGICIPHVKNSHAGGPFFIHVHFQNVCFEIETSFYALTLVSCQNLALLAGGHPRS